MTIYKTLIARLKDVGLIVGSLILAYGMAGLIAWAGAAYYGDLDTFMVAFHDAGAYLAILRVSIYGAIVYAWLVWKKKALKQSTSKVRFKHSALRVEIAFAAMVLLIEVIARQPLYIGGVL